MEWDTILPIALRSGSGTTPARNFQITQKTAFFFRMPVANADALSEAPVYRVTFAFEITEQGQNNWRSWIPTTTWESGPDSRDRAGNPIGPFCSGQIDRPGNWRIRIQYAIETEVGIGLDIAVVEG